MALFQITTMMVALNTWKDAEPYRGKMIVFTTEAQGYFGSDMFEKVTVGVVSEESTRWDRGSGYHLFRLVPIGSIHGNCALVNPYLGNWGKIMARLATEEEIKHVLRLVTQKRAEWDAPEWAKITDKFVKHSE